MLAQLFTHHSAYASNVWVQNLSEHIVYLLLHTSQVFLFSWPKERELLCFLIKVCSSRTT